jgi:hypothetical protein
MQQSTGQQLTLLGGSPLPNRILAAGQQLTPFDWYLVYITGWRPSTQWGNSDDMYCLDSGNSSGGNSGGSVLPRHGQQFYPYCFFDHGLALYRAAALYATVSLPRPCAFTGAVRGSDTFIS